MEILERYISYADGCSNAVEILKNILKAGDLQLIFFMAVSDMIEYGRGRRSIEKNHGGSR